MEVADSVSVKNSDGTEFTGRAVLTTARLLWANTEICGSFGLHDIVAATREGGGPLGFGLLEAKKIGVQVATQTAGVQKLVLAFTAGGRDGFLATLKNLLAERDRVRQLEAAKQGGGATLEPEPEALLADAEGQLRRTAIVNEAETQSAQSPILTHRIHG